VTPAFLDRIARGARLDLGRFRRERSARYADVLGPIDQTAQADFQGTPGFAVVGPRIGFALNGLLPTATLFAPVYAHALTASR
jgi:hypothetical protein